MNTSETVTSLMKAMVEAAPEISSICKSKQAYGYKYATLDSLIDMLRGVLPKHGIWFTQMPTRCGEQSTLTTRVFHVSGEWFEDAIQMTDTELQGKANDTQKVGASITYFRRYALSSIFGVAADEDVDGNVANIKQAQAQPKTPQQAQQVRSAAKPDIVEQMRQAVDLIGKDYTFRTDAGEPVESVLASYARILKTDKVRKVKEMQSAEILVLAKELQKGGNNVQ